MKEKDKIMDDVKISVVYDNQLHDQNLKTGFGFACLIEYSGEKILFDTGDDAEKLLFNLDSLQINPQDFTAIVISHNHWDHTGGLNAVLKKNKHCTLYFGKSYPGHFQDRIRAQRTNFILVEDLRAIAEGVFVGPEMGGFTLQEIPLTIETNQGLVVITGCAHPGILKIAQTVKEALHKDIYLVLGGFHLGLSLGLNAIAEGLRKLGVKKVAACHCTGERAVSLFKENYQEDFIKVGAGWKLIIE